MCDYFSYTTADIVFIDDKRNSMILVYGQNAAKQKSDGQADDKETVHTDEKTKESGAMIK